MQHRVVVVVVPGPEPDVAEAGDLAEAERHGLERHLHEIPGAYPGTAAAIRRTASAISSGEVPMFSRAKPRP